MSSEHAAAKEFFGQDYYRQIRAKKIDLIDSALRGEIDSVKITIYSETQIGEVFSAPGYIYKYGEEHEYVMYYIYVEFVDTDTKASREIRIDLDSRELDLRQPLAEIIAENLSLVV